jgi:hypothetical protein
LWQDNGDLKMKRAILATLSIIAMCGLCLAGTVNAPKAGYTCWNFQGSAPTLDGRYTTTDEWTDSYKDYLYSGWTMTTNPFRDKWNMESGIYETWIIEVLSDTTNDAGDYFQICYDGQGDGGTAPQTDDVLINYTGHSTSTAYRGTGTGWAPDAAIVFPDNVQIASSIAASPTSATPHWIIEMKFGKDGTSIPGMGIDTAVRVAAYDASNPSQGVLTWPPTANRDVPNDYGLDDADITGGTIPEGLTIGVMVALSSVAVVVSARYFRKQPKL